MKALTTGTIALEVPFGPAMEALNERQRGFVIAYCTMGYADKTAAARAAGYKESPNGRGLSTQAQALMHNPRIQAAVVEFGKARLHEMLPNALKALEDIVNQPGHKKQLDAARVIMNRAGLQERMIVEHTGEILLSAKEKVMEIKQMAKLLGLKPEDVLGQITDVEFEDVPAEAEPEEIPTEW